MFFMLFPILYGKATVHYQNQALFVCTGDVISVLFHVQRGQNKMKNSGKWKDPIRAHTL
jgi:hypothetical protein